MKTAPAVFLLQLRQVGQRRPATTEGSRMNSRMYILPSWKLEIGSPGGQSCTSIDGAGQPLFNLELILYSTVFCPALRAPEMSASCLISGRVAVISKRGACSICWTIDAGATTLRVSSPETPKMYSTPRSQSQYKMCQSRLTTDITCACGKYAVRAV